LEISDDLRPDQMNVLNNKTNYPKPEMRLQFDQYPELPKAKKKNKGREIEQILNADEKWHRDNN